MLSHGQFPPQAITCFLWGKWPQPNASFQTVAHAASGVSIKLSEESAICPPLLTDARDWWSHCNWRVERVCHASLRAQANFVDRWLWHFWFSLKILMFRELLLHTFVKVRTFFSMGESAGPRMFWFLSNVTSCSFFLLISGKRKRKRGLWWSECL